jgi:hypothetical protein
MPAKLAFIAPGFDAEGGVGACGRDGNVRANTVQRRGGRQGARVHGLNAYRDAVGCGPRGNSAAARVTPELRPLLLLPGTLQPYFQCLLL